MNKIIDDKLKSNIICYYKSRPMTISECAEYFGLSNPTIIKILDEFMIERYSKARLYNPNLDERYFKNIDSEKKAYFLGFLIADGNVYNDNSGRQSSISITQSQEDSYILEEFLKELNSNTSLGHDGRGCCQAAVRSNIMAYDLSKYGVIPNKTYISYLPILNKSLMSHLIRGILDGDGNITSVLLDNNRHKHAISFCGSHNLMYNISLYISSLLNISLPSVYIYKNRHLTEIKWQSINDCLILGNWIYNNAEIYLSRKYIKFCEFKQYYNI